MELKERLELQRLSRRRSQLVSLGGVLLLLAIIAPRPLAAAAAKMEGSARSLAFIATDLFRLCFFAGVACLIIGGLRNRRWRREAEAAQRAATQGTPQPR